MLFYLYDDSGGTAGRDGAQMTTKIGTNKPDLGADIWQQISGRRLFGPHLDMATVDMTPQRLEPAPERVVEERGPFAEPLRQTIE